jgi:hypothetical protein
MANPLIASKTRIAPDDVRIALFATVFSREFLGTRSSPKRAHTDRDCLRNAFQALAKTAFGVEAL